MSENSANDVLINWLSTLDMALKAQNIDAAIELFDDECYWRDLVSFTWNFKTLENRDEIRQMLQSQLAVVRPSNWQPVGDASENEEIVEGLFTFETLEARGRGYVRLKNGKCWTLFTSMEELKGHEERKGPTRAKGTNHGQISDRKSWAELRAEEEATLGITRQPECLIIGGGQGGIALGARLKMLNVPTIIVEKNARAGDSWRKRYKSLCLHDPVWYDHMPYIPFPDHWPVFTPKDKIGDWLEFYTKIMELNYWSNTECESASYDELSGTWTVNVMRDGQPVTIRPKQLILATGMSGKANIPVVAGQEKFVGEQHHSSKHPGPDQYKDKKCLVVGSNNSAHDIAAALAESGAAVTMMQRSSTMVAQSDTVMDLGLGALYSEEALANGIDHELADLIFASIPYKILGDLQKPVYEEFAERDKDFYEQLKAAGFLLDFGEDDTGLFMKYLRRGSGYYINVGGSELIINGTIKLKSGVELMEVKPNSVVFSDGSEQPFDLIVYATGYNSMNGWAAELISQEVADRVGKCWGLGSDTTKDPGPWEGELRNMWKPTQQPALWFHGGNLHQSRHYSRFLALQLKARQAGMNPKVYGIPEVHHKS